MSAPTSATRGDAAAWTQGFEGLIDALHIGVYRSSLDGRQLRANAALVKLNGFESESQMLAEVNDIAGAWYVEPARRDEFAAVLARDGEVRDFVSEIHRYKTRERIWIVEHARLVRDASGVPLFYEGTVQDITAQVVAERGWAGEQNLLRALLQAIPDPVWAITPDGRYLLGNRALEQLHGMSWEELSRKGMREVLPADAVAQAMAVNAQVMRAPGPVTYEYAYNTLGTTQRYEVRKVALRDQQGVATGVVGIARDISARVAHSAELEAARDDAQAASRAKAAFLANMSHEIRTPLNAVVATSDLLRETDLGAHQAKLVKTLGASARALLGVVNDVLDFSKIDAGQMALECIETDLMALCDDSLEVVRPVAHGKGLSMRAEFDLPNGHLWLGDPTRIKQVLVNLLGNAVKFTATGAVVLRVTEQTREGRSGVLLCVTDTGIGISESEMGRLFGSFEQGDASTTRRFGGTGLGLAISHGLVQAMGGGIHVASTLGDGAQFEVWLPRQSQAAPSKVSDEPVRVAANFTTPDSQSPLTTLSADDLSMPATQGSLPTRVLIAEDNETNQWLIKVMVERAGYRAEIANNGLEALRMLLVAASEDDAYRAVLMDVQMPELDGLSATRRLRQELARDAQPYVIALTANASTDDRAQCLAAGMDAFLAKPVRPAEVARALRDATTESNRRSS